MNLKRWMRKKPLAAAFQIGLKPVDRDDRWLAPFDGLANYLSEKETLFAQKTDDVFGDMGGTQVAQIEACKLITEHLASSFPDTYRPDNIDFVVSMDKQELRIEGDQKYPLRAASRLVADDLVIMQKREMGWYLAAGSVCFPSVWKLQEKLGRLMAEVHAPVPRFGAGTRHAQLIERIFDNLPIGQTVERGNWSIHQSDSLHLPEHDALTNSEIAKLFLRGEVQTLTKLSSGRDILFTIGVFVNPLAQLATMPDKAAELARQLAIMDADELHYKGLTDVRDRLQLSLNDIADIRNN